MLCSRCRNPLTASWSSGRNKKFAYYRCKTKECHERNKSIKKGDIEGSFKEILVDVRPKQQILNLAQLCLVNVWKKKLQESGGIVVQHEKKLRKVQDEIKVLIDRITRTGNNQVIQAYEKRIEELSNEELLVKEKIESLKTPRMDFETASDVVFGILKNPYDKWLKGGIHQKRLVFKLVFSDKLVYDRERGFETAHLSLPLRVFTLSEEQNSSLVEMVGIEPTCKKVF